MDNRALMLRMLRKEFGNLLNSARIKTVTIFSVDFPNKVAVVDFASGEVSDPVTDQQTVQFLESYFPQVGEVAYLLLAEGAPILIGAVESSPWTNLALPTGYAAVAGLTPPGYRIDSTGRVWFRGGCNIGASNATGTKFTLPAGFRPPDNTRVLAVPYSNGTAISDHLRYNVSTAGVMATVLATPAATIFITFEGVSFDTR